MKFHIFIKKSMKINFDRFVLHEIGSPSSKITLPGPKTKKKTDLSLKIADFLKKLIFSIFGPGSARNKWPAPSWQRWRLSWPCQLADRAVELAELAEQGGA